MPVRRSLVLGPKAGVRLDRVDQVGADGRVMSTEYRLTTLRPAQPRLIADPHLAEEAFDLEVLASLSDPVVSKLVEQGW